MVNLMSYKTNNCIPFKVPCGYHMDCTECKALRLWLDKDEETTKYYFKYNEQLALLIRELFNVDSIRNEDIEE